MPAPAARPLSPTEKRDWLRLIRTEHIGPITFSDLLDRYGDAGAALDALPELARRGGRARTLNPMSAAAADAEIEATEATGARLIARCEPDYPALLAAIPDPPPVIAVRGRAELLGRPAVAIVGARNASANACGFARRLAGDLAVQDFVVVSGMARGIDGHAHQGALERGTVAVLAGGVDVVYPPEHAELYREIAARGAVVSETAVGTEPLARHFPRRNRIISGLALGVCVVEAAARSGSLITARCAAEQGREVFAVPGFPLDPRAGGGNALLKDGAILVESADDILQNLTSLARPAISQAQSAGLRPEPAPPSSATEIESARATLEDALGGGPVSVDELVRHTGLSPAAVNGAVLELELAGRLERFAGGRIALKV